MCWSLFPKVEDHDAGDCRGKADRHWALRTWCTGAYEMFLTSVLATRKVKGKRKRSGERRRCFPVQSWELRNARLGNMELLGGMFTAGFCCPEIAGNG